MSAKPAYTPAYRSLLCERDGPSFEIINPYGESAIVLVCEHASSLVPMRLNNLGLTADQLNSHVG